MQHNGQQSAEIKYHYNSLNKIAQTLNYQGKTLISTDIYGYNKLGSVNKIQRLDNVSAADDAIIDTTEYGYNPDGQIKSKTLTYRNLALGITQTYIESYTYDHLKRLITVVHDNNVINRINDGAITTTHYVYDDNNNRTKKITDTIYNGSAAVKQTSTAPIEIDYTHNNYNQLTHVSSQANDFQYDDNGNITSNGKGDTYTYDSNNKRLTYASAGGTSTASYRYYVDGSRQKETYKNHTVTFFYDSSRVLNERDEQGNVSNYLMVGNQRLARLTTIDGTTTVHFMDSDAHGSVVGSRGVDEQKVSSTHTDYDAYGHITQNKSSLKIADSESPLLRNHFLYTGEYQDPADDSEYLRARDYSPQTGSFYQRDDAIFPNPYAYANDNPVMGTDPTGHMDSSLMMSLILGAASAVLITGLTGGMGDLAILQGEEPEYTTQTIDALRSYKRGKAITPIARLAFMAGNAAPAAVNAGTEFAHGDIKDGVGDSLIAVSGLVGSWSAQPDLMTNIEGAAKDNMAKASAVGSQLLMGAGIGVKGMNNSEDPGLYIAACVGAGALAGEFYGRVSSYLKSPNVLGRMLYGSIRTGVSGLIAGAPGIYEAIKHHGVSATLGSLKNFWLDHLIPFALGAASGLTQGYFADANKSCRGFNFKFMSASFGRMFYLFVKPPLMTMANT